MAGRHRGPSIKKNRLRSKLARINFAPKIDRVVRQLAEDETRSYGNMLTVLATEALRQRGLLK